MRPNQEITNFESLREESKRNKSKGEDSKGGNLVDSENNQIKRSSLKPNTNGKRRISSKKVSFGLQESKYAE
jgi:hypothetical protein